MITYGMDRWSVGDILTAKLYGGKKEPRRVIQDRGDRVVICNEEEWQLANSIGVHPRGLAFRREDVEPLPNPPAEVKSLRGI